MKIVLVFMIIVFVDFNLFSQNTVDFNNNTGFGLQIGYNYRKENEINAGLNYLMYSKTNYKKASLFGGGIEGYLLWGSDQSLGTRMNLEYVFWNKSKMGFQANFSGDLNKYIKYGFDAKIGINYSGVYYFYYGYNLYRNQSTMLLTKHSFGLIFRLNSAIFDLEYP